MKRYWLFAGDNYYPSGGMTDYVDQFDTINEATNAHVRSNDPSGEWADVLDIESMDIVRHFYSRSRDDEGQWKD